MGLIDDNKGKVIPLLAKADPKDLAIEALRSFRTSLQFVTLDAKNNILTIMGISPSVGKSFVSSNFAYLLAEAGKKVLLIDGDIRRGHLRDYFKISKLKGLSDVVVGQCSLESVLLKGTLTETLDFLPAGTYPPNPSELLMSHQFHELLQKVSKLYDHVIIDTAPILAVTDAAIIAQQAGANFMVVASNKHEPAEVDMALRRLQTNGVTLSGSIFNFTEQSSHIYGYHGYGYNYKYKYQYAYKYDS